MVAYPSSFPSKPSEPSVMELLSDVIRETSNLVEEHIQLFKSQVKDESLKVVKISLFAAMGFLFSIAFVMGLGTAIVLLLAQSGVALWGAVGIVTGLFLVFMLMMFGLGYKEFKTHYQDRFKQTEDALELPYL